MLNNMEYIYAVYKEKSFSKAAEKLFISQPSLSITVKKVEEKLGLPVFNRGTTPVSLTPFGVEYIQAVERIRAIEERLKNFVEDEKSLKSGSLAIGGSNFGISYLVPRVLADFKRTYPSIELKIAEMNTMKAKHVLDSGELDMIVTNRPLDSEKYEQLSCYREHLILAVPNGLPVNERLKDKRLSPKTIGAGIFAVPKEKSVSMEEMAKTPFILLQGDNYLRRCVDMIFQEARLVPKIILETEQSSISYNFTRMGIGATILSNRLAEDSVMDSRLSFYKIDSAYAVRDTYICYRKGRYFSYAMSKFVEMMMEAGGESPYGAGNDIESRHRRNLREREIEK